MPPGGKPLSRFHDRVDGVIIGSLGIDPPSPLGGEWSQLRFAYEVFRECAAVVSYVADAEERHGFPTSAAHYRGIGVLAGDAVPIVRRVAIGADGLPLTLLDELRMGVARLSAGVDDLLRLTGSGRGRA